MLPNRRLFFTAKIGDNADEPWLATLVSLPKEKRSSEGRDTRAFKRNDDDNHNDDDDDDDDGHGKDNHEDEQKS